MNVVLVLVAFWLPGLLFGAALRLRGWSLVAGAPALTFGLVALGIYVLGKLDIGWTPTSVVGWFAIASAAAWGCSLLVMRSGLAASSQVDSTRGEQSRPVRDHLLITAGMAAGMAVGAVAFLRGVGGLNSIHQDWDAPFHANLVRWIAEHHSALPSAIGAVDNAAEDPNYFYPDVYHALLALVFGAVGMPELMNLGALAVVLALPVGIAALCAAWRMPTLAVASAAAVSTWFSALLYDSLMRGPLWPYVAAIVLIPAVLAMVRRLVEPGGATAVLGVSVAVTGLVGLHTSAAFVVATVLLLLLIALVAGWEPVDWRYARWQIGAAAVLSLALASCWLLPALAVAEGVTDFVWPSQASVMAAIGQMVTFSPDAALPQWWIGVPAFIGVFLLFVRRRLVWLAVLYLLAGSLYVATVSTESTLIHVLTGPFYNDHWRIGALLPLAGAVAFGEFVSAAGEACAARVRKWRPAWSGQLLTTAAVLVIGLCLAGLARGAYIGRNSSRLATEYTNGPTVSQAERAAYTWIDNHLVTGGRVMNGPYDGSVWLYALTGLRPVVWTFNGAPDTSPGRLLVHRLDELTGDGPVRSALNALDVRYVVIGDGYVRSWLGRAEGLRELSSNPYFRVVYRNRDAVIFEILGQKDVAR